MTARRVYFGTWETEGGMRVRSLREPAALLISIYQTGRMARGGRVVRVPARTARVLAALFVGRVLSTAELVELLWGDCKNGGPDYADRIVSKEILTARLIGAALGFNIQARSGGGYSARLADVQFDETGAAE